MADKTNEQSEFEEQAVQLAHCCGEDDDNNSKKILALITKAQIEVLEWVKSELKKSTLLEQDKFWDDITPMIDQEIAKLRGEE